MNKIVLSGLMAATLALSLQAGATATPVTAAVTVSATMPVTFSVTPTGGWAVTLGAYDPNTGLLTSGTNALTFTTSDTSKGVEWAWTSGSTLTKGSDTMNLAVGIKIGTAATTYKTTPDGTWTTIPATSLNWNGTTHTSGATINLDITQASTDSTKPAGSYTGTVNLSFRQQT
ncbi:MULTISPECIES: hypothetical protein [unclassified Paludibacterium]|uniref:hypothetical protein n=1 Tax=unclassified Paludibacterium TaxID=2618429 RepID=UPI001C05B376|nr:hypothetical protein [Paludibacterium sp. B53371]BEV70745.1 hypothetical protein THUN1379_02270 [Paludibacterium sp. THUN1379]